MAVISRLPFGERLHRECQRLLGTNRLAPSEGVARAMEIVELAESNGLSIQNSVCLEIGTGWRPYLPVILQLLGAKKTITYDIHPWATKNYLQATLAGIEENLGVISRHTDVTVDQLRERLHQICEYQGDLRQILKQTGIDYRCPGDATKSDLLDRSVDIVCSSNVLEHVHVEVLRAMHRESLRVLRRGGFVVHRFNPADHSSFVDKRVTSVNFLKYSQPSWDWMAKGLAYHNRLRCKQHVELLQDAGLEIVYQRVRPDPGAEEVLAQGGLKVHPDFERFSVEELAGSYMWVVARALAVETALLPDTRPDCRADRTALSHD